MIPSGSVKSEVPWGGVCHPWTQLAVAAPWVGGGTAGVAGGVTEAAGVALGEEDGEAVATDRDGDGVPVARSADPPPRAITTAPPPMTRATSNAMSENLRTDVSERTSGAGESRGSIPTSDQP
jgi:hypothetical protein